MTARVKISKKCWYTCQGTCTCTSSALSPPLAARVKISQNVDILPKVYLVHLKVEHCQTLCVVSTFAGQNELTVFWLVNKHCLVLFRVIKVKNVRVQHCCHYSSAILGGLISMLVLFQSLYTLNNQPVLELRKGYSFLKT